MGSFCRLEKILPDSFLSVRILFHKNLSYCWDIRKDVILFMKWHKSFRFNFSRIRMRTAKIDFIFHHHLSSILFAIFSSKFPHLTVTHEYMRRNRCHRSVFTRVFTPLSIFKRSLYWTVVPATPTKLNRWLTFAIVILHLLRALHITRSTNRFAAFDHSRLRLINSSDAPAFTNWPSYMGHNCELFVLCNHEERIIQER